VDEILEEADTTQPKGQERVGRRHGAGHRHSAHRAILPTRFTTPGNAMPANTLGVHHVDQKCDPGRPEASGDPTGMGRRPGPRPQ